MLLKGKNKKYWTVTRCQQCKEDFAVYKRELEKGKGKFCSVACGVTYRNIVDNPTKCPDVRRKISENHADVSGENNPMYGVKGKDAPGYIDGRSQFKGESYRKKALANLKHECEFCGKRGLDNLEVHHKDYNRKNNKLSNLQILCKECHRVNFHLRPRDELGRFTSSGKGVV